MYQTVFNRSKRIAVLAAALVLAGGASAAHADALKCRRSIAKNAAGFEAAKIGALQKCNDARLNGKVPSCPDPKATDKIGKALTKMQDKIAKDCAGLTVAEMGFAQLAQECTGGYFPGLPCAGPSDCSGVCVGGAKDGDPCTAQAVCTGGSCEEIGQCDPVDKCPSVQNDRVTTPAHLDCYAPLSDAASVATCVACVGEGTVDQLIDNYYGTARAASADKATLKCQRTVGKVAAKHFATVRKALQGCQDGVLKGGAGPCPDGKASGKISKSQTKLIDAIGKACTAAQLNSGFVLSQLVAVTGRPAAECTTVSSDPAALAAAIECLTAASAADSDALAVGSSPPSANPTCGNARLDAGETCDDGNQLQESGVGPADFCPSDCTIAPCTPNGTVTATVSFAAGADLTGMTVVVYYNDTKVRIPGQNNDPPVQAAVSSASFAMTPVDTDYALRNVLIDPFVDGVAPGEAFTITFDTCQGAPAPVAGDFQCFVADASDTALAPYVGATCSVSVP